LGFGVVVGGVGFGVLGPTPQTPIPNPQSPIPRESDLNELKRLNNIFIK